jgi:hypothetical protein
MYANMMGCDTDVSPVDCGFLDSRNHVQVSDSLASPQLMADVDVYPDSNVCGSTACYDATYGPVAAQMPLVAGETGAGDSTAAVETFINWMDAHHAGYYAWAWDTWAGLISDYNGTAASPWGTYYQDHIADLP